MKPLGMIPTSAFALQPKIPSKVLVGLGEAEKDHVVLLGFGDSGKMYQIQVWMFPLEMAKSIRLQLESAIRDLEGA